MTWSESTSQRAERRAQEAALRSFGWRGGVDATGYPLHDGLGEVARGWSIGAARSEPLDVELVSVQAENDAIYGGGHEYDLGTVDAFTQWSARRLHFGRGRWRRGGSR
jgi:hypothetical protein